MNKFNSTFICLTAALLLTACQKSMDTAVWEERLELPTAEEIEACNNTSTQRSPYIAGWLKNDKVTRFTKYSADIKADYLPLATYCSPVNLTLDYSSLKDKYTNVWNDDGIGMYAGLQRREADEHKIEQHPLVEPQSGFDR